MNRFWGICCLFNPFNFVSRLENYRVFRRSLRIPLVTVELSTGGAFQLDDGDADILVRISSTDILWQKERLFNLALKELPEECTKFAWLDCDVVFDSPGWVDDASTALESVPVVHLFEEFYDLGPREKISEAGKRVASGQSVIGLLNRGSNPAEVLIADMRRKTKCVSGLAWAARREIFSREGFYDACVIGGGNRALLGAQLGLYDLTLDYLRMNNRQREHYMEWARRHRESVRGGVRTIPGRVYHLWHGNLHHRRYAHRFRDFSRFAFNPYLDILLDENGVWRWNSPKPEMHEFVRKFFKLRREDEDK